jgi:hypothetical protein
MPHKAPDFLSIDDTERERVYFEDDRMWFVRDSLNEARIMAENRELRQWIRRTEWCRPVLRMSLAQYEHLCRLFPDFRPGGDQVERRRVIERICRDPDYRDLCLGKP